MQATKRNLYRIKKMNSSVKPKKNEDEYYFQMGDGDEMPPTKTEEVPLPEEDLDQNLMG